MTCKTHGWLEPHLIYTRHDGRRECRLCQRESMRRARAGTRRTMKQYLAEKKGEVLPLAATAPRRKRRRSDAHLTRAQIRAAYTLYVGGMTVPQLAERLWERYGFVSAASCRESLYDAFRLDGLGLDHARSMRLAYAAKGCGGCGGPTDSRTVGCHACAARMWHRRQKAARPSEERRAA